MIAERNGSMTGAKRHSLCARLNAIPELFRHSGSREATVRNLEKTLLTGYRITTESCPV